MSRTQTTTTEPRGPAVDDDRKATDILKEDHGAVKGLFKEYRALEAGADAEKQRLFDEIDGALTVHATVEEAHHGSVGSSVLDARLQLAHPVALFEC